MVDKDMKVVKAIEEAYHDAEVSVLLCWFHVLQVCSRGIGVIKSFKSWKCLRVFV